jgi:protein-tyrosine phosphatase
MIIPFALKKGRVGLIQVLFVCLGNICRSPMAEAMFRDMVKREKLDQKIAVDSAGIGGWHIGESPHHGTLSILKKYQINHEGLVARQVQREDLNKFDYIVAMDQSNVDDLHKLAGDASTTHIIRLLDLVEESEQKDVPDPYFTGNFEEVYELIKKGCDRLLALIKKEHNL